MLVLDRAAGLFYDEHFSLAVECNSTSYLLSSPVVDIAKLINQNKIRGCCVSIRQVKKFCEDGSDFITFKNDLEDGFGIRVHVDFERTMAVSSNRTSLAVEQRSFSTCTMVMASFPIRRDSGPSRYRTLSQCNAGYT